MEEHSADASQHPPGTVPGKWVVVSMFAFASLAVGVLWLYWSWHTAPFRPLQEALGREFPRSRPLVQGGQRKIHKETPAQLRIVMRIEFDPDADSDRTEELARQIASFAGEHHDLGLYDTIEIHLHWPEPEQEIKQWSTSIPVEGIEAQDSTTDEHG